MHEVAVERGAVFLFAANVEVNVRGFVASELADDHRCPDGAASGAIPEHEHILAAARVGDLAAK